MSIDGSGAGLVLVVGDANPDLILTGDVVPRFGQAEQLVDSATLTIGGSAAITAHALARLGRPVWLVAAVGADRFGDQMCADLAAAGVGVDQVVRRQDAPTGLTVVLSQRADRAILTLPGAISSLRGVEVARAATAAASAGLRHVHVSSLFLQPDLARDLPELLAEVRRLGVTTSLDTNDDPSGRWEGVDALLPHLDLLLPNRAEAVALARETEPRRAAAVLAARGPVVVVKDGAHGAFAVTPAGDLVDALAEPRSSVDTTGAGDTFGAAFVDAWLDGSELSRCLRRAVLAGAFAVSALGGTTGQPTSDDLTDREGTALTASRGTKGQ
jgi:ribokinase